MRIGLIGLGLMGIPMARNILSKGGDLSVWSRSKEKIHDLENLGAKICDSKKSLAEQSNVLITMVTAGEDVDDILFGEDGVTLSLVPGSIVIDMSTIGVEWAVEISDKLRERGIHFIDAPVTGSTPKAITGELTIFVGGGREIFEKVKPILSMTGTNLQYMGPIGSGQAMKLVNNMLVAYTMIGLGEVMKLGSAMGLEKGRLAEVVRTLPVSSPYTSMKIDNYVRDDYPMMFSLANMTKDITLAHDEMEKYGLSLDMLELAYQQYHTGLESGLGDMDVSAIAKL